MNWFLTFLSHANRGTKHFEKNRLLSSSMWYDVRCRTVLLIFVVLSIVLENKAWQKKQYELFYCENKQKWQHLSKWRWSINYPFLTMSGISLQYLTRSHQFSSSENNVSRALSPPFNMNGAAFQEQVHLRCNHNPRLEDRSIECSTWG